MTKNFFFEVPPIAWIKTILDQIGSDSESSIFYLLANNYSRYNVLSFIKKYSFYKRKNKRLLVQMFYWSIENFITEINYKLKFEN